jgi:DNA-binding SARP family transcriptional activator/tetratricopeptide (TPR) repeat protein
MGEMAVKFRLLGPVKAEMGGQLVDIGHARQRCVLAVLLLEANRFVSADQLVDRVWGNGRLPGRPRNAVQTYVSLLRRALARTGELTIARQPNGYMIRIDEQLVDVHEFRILIRKARSSGGDDDAAVLYERALALWQGEALGNVDTPWFSGVRAVLDKERQTAERDLTDIQLRQGRHSPLLPRLSEWADQQPLDERLAGQLMLALYRSGRRASALAQYQRIRGLLAGELGIDTSTALQGLHQQILTADPALAVPVTGPGAGPAGSALVSQLPSALAVRCSLPPDAASFTGRDEELASITAAVTDAGGAGSVATIRAIGGMPGMGKTALAVHAAHLLRDRFPDRQLFIDLHAHTPGQDPVLPAAALASLLTATGVDARALPADTEGRAALWRDRMAGQRALLVLDNAASSVQVAPLLPGGDECLVLVTSRRHLGDLPGIVPVVLEALPLDQAEAMFSRLAPRVAAAGPGSAVRELMRLAGCLPLAISLLARVYTRHPSWTLAELTRETQTSLLTLAAENHSVAAAVEVSYRYLAPAQQQFFRRLGQHPGATIDAYAAAALAGLPLAEAIGCLDALHGEGLLTEVGYRRYGMHDLIRRYTRDLNAADPAADRDHGLDRLLDYYQHTAVITHDHLARQSRTRPVPAAGLTWPAVIPDLPDRERALFWARTERANLLTCLDHASRTGQLPRIVAFTAAIAALLRQDGPWADAITLHATAVQAASDCGDRLGQANALTELGDMRYLTGDYPSAVEDLGKALTIYRDIGDWLGQANALSLLGALGQRSGDYRSSAEAQETALRIYRDIGDRLGQVGALRELGAVRFLTADYPGAVEDLEKALTICRDTGNRLGQANALNDLGVVRAQTGDYRGAAEAQETALHVYRDIGNRLGQANALRELGAVKLRTGHHQAAAQAIEEALDTYRDIGDRLGQACALLYVGVMRRETKDYPGAGAALDEALRACRALGDRGSEVSVLNEVGTLHRVCADHDRAAACHRQALDLALEIHSSWDEAGALAGLGRCALAAGRTADAAASLRQAREIFQRIGAAEAVGLAAELRALTEASA